MESPLQMQILKGRRTQLDLIFGAQLKCFPSPIYLESRSSVMQPSQRVESPRRGNLVRLRLTCLCLVSTHMRLSLGIPIDSHVPGAYDLTVTVTEPAFLGPIGQAGGLKSLSIAGGPNQIQLSGLVVSPFFFPNSRNSLFVLFTFVLFPSKRKNFC